MKKPIKPSLRKPEKTDHKFFYMYNGYSDGDVKLFETNVTFDADEDYSIHNRNIRFSQISAAVNQLSKTFNIASDKILISLIEDRDYDCAVMEFHIILEKSDEEFNKELEQYNKEYNKALEEYNKAMENYKAYNKTEKIQKLEALLEKYKQEQE